MGAGAATHSRPDAANAATRNLKLLIAFMPDFLYKAVYR
jgi:hypothetical protein